MKSVVREKGETPRKTYPDSVSSTTRPTWSDTITSVLTGKGFPFTGHEGPLGDVDARVHIYTNMIL